MIPPDTPLPYRLRSEIEWTSIQGRFRDWWVAIDPLRSQQFRCGDEEQRILKALDGRRSIHDLERLLVQHESVKRISANSIEPIIQSALQKQLLVPCAANSPADLKNPIHAASPILNRWLRWIQRSPFTLIQGRVRLGNPQWFLPALASRTNWLFSPMAVRFWILFVAFSAILVITKLAAQSRFTWPSITAFETSASSYILILVLTRILHELGHAIVCTRLGAGCRDFGVFIMMGIMCPYVDVTDSWRLKNHYQRMSVAAAGVYVEWIIAAVAGLVWYTSQLGWLTDRAWQVMMVCWITTFLINANPLMRYDGYFILSDFWEVANLREEAESTFKKFMLGWCRRSPSDSIRWIPSYRECSLIAYTCASWMYRSSLLVALAWSVHSIAQTWHLPLFGSIFAILLVVSFLLIPLGQMMFQSWSASLRSSYGPYRFATLWLAILVLLVHGALLPLPHRIACSGTVNPESQTFVYTQVAGRLPLNHPTNISKTGTQLSLPLIALENPWLADQAQQASQRQRQFECQVSSLRQAAYHQPTKIDQLPSLMALVSIAEKQSRHAVSELDALSIFKPQPGRWMPIALPSSEPPEGNVTEPRNYTIEDVQSRGRWFPAGTAIGYIAPSDQVWVATSIPVSQLSSVQLDMPARVRFDQQPDRIYSARVVQLSSMQATPFNGGNLQNSASNATHSGNVENSTSVALWLAVDGASQRELAMGGTAEAVIWSTPKSLYYHTMNFVNITLGPNETRTALR